MTPTSYEIERVHDEPGLPGVIRCSESTCDLSHYYAVYQRLGAPGHQAVWLADYETEEQAQEAIDEGIFHCCDDSCRSYGCPDRFR